MKKLLLLLFITNSATSFAQDSAPVLQVTAEDLTSYQWCAPRKDGLKYDRATFTKDGEITLETFVVADGKIDRRLIGKWTLNNNVLMVAQKGKVPIPFSLAMSEDRKRIALSNLGIADICGVSEAHK